jgi:uncharacterized protein YjgD (DUF1641 family)
MMPIFLVYNGAQVDANKAYVSYLTLEDAQRMIIGYNRLVQQIGALKSEQLAPDLKCYMENLAAADGAGD